MKLLEFIWWLFEKAIYGVFLAILLTWKWTLIFLAAMIWALTTIE